MRRPRALRLLAVNRCAEPGSGPNPSWTRCAPALPWLQPIRHKSNNLGPWSTPKLPQIPSSFVRTPQPPPHTLTLTHSDIHKFHHSPHSIHFGMCCPSQSLPIKVVPAPAPYNNCWLRRNTFFFFCFLYRSRYFPFLSVILYELCCFCSCCWLRESI